MKYLFLFFLLSNYAMAETCHMELFSKIYRLENNQSLSNKDIIYKTDCAHEVSQKITQIISNANGVVTAGFLEKEFTNSTVDIQPRKISLLNLNTILHEQLATNTNLYFFNTQSMNQTRTLSLLDGESAKAVCESCNNFGEKNIKIDINNPINNTSRTQWFTSKILAKTKVLKAKRNLGYQEKSLSIDDFYTEETFTQNPQNVLSNLDNIHFFKPNKNILEGSIVSNMDLQAVNLVNYGTPVNLTLKSQNISLSKIAMPARSALFGEMIEVQTLNNNKKVLGRVIDFNKVVVEL